jgi:hypothetical protein
MAQSHQSLFDKYAETDGVTTIYISKAMFNIMPTMIDFGLSFNNMKGKIESLNMLITEKKSLVPQLKTEFAALIDKNHQELMRVREGKNRITFYGKMNGEHINDLLMVVDDDKSSYIIMELLGNFTLRDLQEIAGDGEE